MNNYNEDFIQRNTHRPTTITDANDNATPTTTATIPYIKDISENISCILKPFIIRVAHKPITTLRQLLTTVKDKDEPSNRQGAAHKINCSDCHASDIGESGRNLTTRLTEHKRATRKGDVNNHIVEHHRLTNHTIDCDSAQCLINSTKYFQRLNLESWFTGTDFPQQVSTTTGAIQTTHSRHEHYKQTEQNYLTSLTDRDRLLTTDLRHLSLTANNITDDRTTLLHVTPGFKPFTVKVIIVCALICA